MTTTKKRAKKPPVDLNRLPVWTVTQASRWSYIPYRTLLRMIRAGMVPVIRCEPARPAASKRKLLIPREPFLRWLNTPSPAVGATTGETAA
jgi:hypothetical protein